MGDEGSTGGKRRNGLSIFLGVVGTVLGFVGGLALYEVLGLSNSADPIASGMIALFAFGPMGALAGLFLGVKLGMLGRTKPDGAEAAPQTSAGSETAGTPTRNALKALAIVIAVVAVVGGGYYLYAVATATPWLRPGGVALQFEVRLPAGAPMPDARGVKAELQTNINTMPAEMAPNLFRQDGDRPVIVGQVDLAYRTNSRQIEVKIPGRMDRTYQIKIADTLPHAAALGAWQAHPDGSEIRYRAKWPGRE